MSEETTAQPGDTAAPVDGAPAPADTANAETPSTATSEPGAGAAEATAGSPDGQQPPKRKRRRRRRRKKSGDATEGTAAEGAPDTATEGPAPTASPADEVAASMANLARGLFSHLDDREIPCRLDGCNRTWVWTADEQIKNFGQPPPRRVCTEHAAQLDSVKDVTRPCANPGCDKTWTWTRGARSAQLSRGGPDRPPQRQCDDCQAEEKALADREAPCKVGGCRRTWTWTRDGQLKHRTWLRRTGGEPEAAERGQGRGRKRGRRRKKSRGSIHDPPPRMCEPCREKLNRLSEREGPCKVHGCTRMAKVDRDTQLRAWASLHTEDLDAEVPSLPRRMCEVCREFCKNHPDREIACGRPGCDKSWTFKTGAQLQAFLAGRLEDPVRLCDECNAGDFVALERPAGAPVGAEVMPCIVLGCEGAWYWLPGTQLASAGPGEEPPDRMCAEHRSAVSPSVEADNAGDKADDTAGDAAGEPVAEAAPNPEAVVASSPTPEPVEAPAPDPA